MALTNTGKLLIPPFDQVPIRSVSGIKIPFFRNLLDPIKVICR